MKKIFTSLFATAAVALTAGAQQLPNNGFEEAWVECVPWTSGGNTNASGTSPQSWKVANTYAMTLQNIVAEKVDGYESAGAVKLKNIQVAGQDIPGYFGLGTPWATSKGMFKITNKAGGEFGGIEFAYRPDAIQFMYQSTGDAQPTVLAYIWNGKFVQKNVSGEIKLTGNPTKVDMVDRDRNVIGMADAPEGGEVTEKGTLVALVNSRLEASTTDWTKGAVEFTYSDAAAPEKINVVFAADDYFSSSPKKDNTLTVDDVKLIYYSRLKSLKVNGVDVPDFDPDTYSYSVETTMEDATEGIATVCMGNSGSAKAAVALDPANNKATVTVTNSNVGGADVDGETSHVYTINFKPAQTDEKAIEYKGTLTIEMFETEMTGGGQDATIQIIPNADKTECTFLLPDFKLESLGDESLGDIKVDNVKMTQNDGVTTFTGYTEGLKLAEDAIEANVTISGTCDAQGNVKMKIDVLWTNNDPQIPIYVEFNGKGDPIPSSGVESIESENADAPAEYFTIQGYKVNGNNLANGFYIVRKGNKVSKIYVK